MSTSRDPRTGRFVKTVNVPEATASDRFPTGTEIEVRNPSAEDAGPLLVQRHGLQGARLRDAARQAGFGGSPIGHVLGLEPPTDPHMPVEGVGWVRRYGDGIGTMSPGRAFPERVRGGVRTVRHGETDDDDR